VRPRQRRPSQPFVSHGPAGVAPPGSRRRIDVGPTIGAMADRVPPGSADETHIGAARLTGDQVEAINRFPDANPNPVMRFDDDGHLIYANPASAGVLKALGV